MLPFPEPRIKKLIWAFGLTFMSLCMGTAMFMMVEGYRVLDAFYMTVITISTVGFQEMRPLSDAGKIFTSLFIIFNLSIFAYIVSIITTYVFEGELQDIYTSYLSNLGVKKMKDHVIICGYGRNGSRAATEFVNAKENFLVIDASETVIKSKLAGQNDIKYLEGDATDANVLKRAGVEKAKAIITTLPKDSDNLYVTLSARELNPNIQIISRASKEGAESKLRFAGAKHVIMPDSIGGMHMANLVIRPQVTQLLEMLNGQGEQGLMLEEVKFENLNKDFQKKTIRELDIRSKTGSTIIGLKRDQEELIINPGPDESIGARSMIILLGSASAIEAFRRLCT